MVVVYHAYNRLNIGGGRSRADESWTNRNPPGPSEGHPPFASDEISEKERRMHRSHFSAIMTTLDWQAGFGRPHLPDSQPALPPSTKDPP